MTTVSILYVGAQGDTSILLERRVREAERAGAEVIRIDGTEPPVGTAVRLTGILAGLPHRSSWSAHRLVAVAHADRLRESQQRALARIADIGEQRGVTVAATAKEPTPVLATHLEVVRGGVRHLRLVTALDRYNDE